MIARRLSANNVVKADPSVMGSIATGQPAQITNVPTGSADILVKVCVDGGRPDLIITANVDANGTGYGQAIPRNSAAIPVWLGSAVAAGDLLKVSAGKWVKCSATDQGWARALQAGASGDVINAEAADKVA